MKYSHIALGLAAVFATCFSAKAQSVVFTSGPINGTIGGYSINEGYAVAESFTLADPATIGSFSFGVWLDNGDTLTSVGWAIASTPFGPGLDFGEVYPVSDFVTSNDLYTIDSESSSLPDVSLAAGTYYFELQYAQTAGNQPAYWDVNDSVNSTGIAYENGLFFEDVAGGSFTLYAVPEPGALALACLGSAVMLGIRRNRLSYRHRFSQHTRPNTLAQSFHGHHVHRTA